MLFRGRAQDQFKNWTEGLACVKAQVFSLEQPKFRIEEKDFYKVEIEEDDVTILFTLVCSCDFPVNKVNEENFFCQHCDSRCEFIGCLFCSRLSSAFELRFPMKDPNADV